MERTLGWRPVGDPVQRLLDAIDECEGLWGDDPAYADVLQHLEKAEQELDVITASPGRRQALRAALPNSSGQVPSDRSETRSQVQRG